MKAERNQDGTYTVQLTEVELFELREACWASWEKLYARRPVIKEDQIEFYRSHDWRFQMLNSMSQEFHRAFSEGWYEGRRLRPNEVPAQAA